MSDVYNAAEGFVACQRKCTLSRALVSLNGAERLIAEAEKIHQEGRNAENLLWFGAFLFFLITGCAVGISLWFDTVPANSLTFEAIPYQRVFIIATAGVLGFLCFVITVYEYKCYAVLLSSTRACEMLWFWNDYNKISRLLSLSGVETREEIRSTAAQVLERMSIELLTEQQPSRKEWLDATLKESVALLNRRKVAQANPQHYITKAHRALKKGS